MKYISLCPRPAHPHVCGEHLSKVDFVIFLWGSSPRMRGTLNHALAFTFGAGLIPTYAGNTNHVRMDALKFRAHPHVCGEHEAVASPANPTLGSSPRMRGTLHKMQLVKV